MKIFLVTMLALMSLTGCDLLCDAGKSGAKLVSTSISNKWGCDQEKMYDYVVSPVSKSLCKKEKKSEGVQSVAKLACQITMQTLVDLGVEEIVSKFDCDRSKVNKDISNTEALCNYVEADSAN